MIIGYSQTKHFEKKYPSKNPSQSLEPDEKIININRNRIDSIVSESEAVDQFAEALKKMDQLKARERIIRKEKELPNPPTLTGIKKPQHHANVIVPRCQLFRLLQCNFTRAGRFNE